MRLIDADTLKTEMTKPIPYDKEIADKLWEGWHECTIAVDRLINNAPTIEPKQGEWIEMGENEDGTHNIKCSYCNMCTKSKGHANSYYTKHIMRYCNSCGAKMEGADNGKM